MMQALPLQDLGAFPLWQFAQKLANTGCASLL
jgi:hypothetical protein